MKIKRKWLLVPLGFYPILISFVVSYLAQVPYRGIEPPWWLAVVLSWLGVSAAFSVAAFLVVLFELV